MAEYLKGINVKEKLKAEINDSLRNENRHIRDLPKLIDRSDNGFITVDDI